MICVLDENLPKKFARVLTELEGPNGIEVRHILDMFPKGTPDTEWIQTLSKLDDCFMITKDRKILRNPAEQKLWYETKLSVFFMQKSWNNQPLWELAWKFIKRWPDIKKSYRKNRSFRLPVSGRIEAVQ